MLNHLKLDEIRSFVLVARLGSFAQAAQAQDVSTSHVSRQLNRLEKTLGVTLMHRTTRVQQLTEAGSAFLIECEAALHRIDQAAQETLHGNHAMRGHIRVNCVGGHLGENLIAPLLTAFMAQHSDITIDLDFSSHRVDLLAERFDVVLRMGAIDDGDFIAKHLFDIDTVTLASPEYLQQHGVPKKPQDLADKAHRCVVGSVTAWQYQTRSGKPMTVDVPPTLSCKNGRVMLSAARAGLGIIRVPSRYCQTEIDQGELVKLFTDYAIPSVPFSLLYHRDKFRPKRIRALIDFIERRVNSNHINLP